MESRKATDIILSLEQEVKKLVATVSSQDLLLKVISNKLSELLNKENPLIKETPKFVMEAVHTNSPLEPERKIPISSENSLLEEHHPQGFRRVSRPETYAGDDAYLKTPNKKKNDISFPVQIPKADGKNEIVVPNIATQVNKVSENKSKDVKQNFPAKTIPIQQRIVDKNGKSIFLADIEVVDLSTVDTVFKGRTNGMGKWQAALPLGEYKVSIKKLESLTKQKVEAVQKIIVDGSQSPLELPMMIMK